MIKKTKKVLLGTTMFGVMLSVASSTNIDDFINAETIKVMESAYASKSTILDKGTCGKNLWYKIDSRGVLTIGSDGKMDDYSLDKLPGWYKEYGGFIEKIVILDGVESIGSYAFFGCSNLKSIYVPRGVTSVGDNAFLACDNFTIYGGSGSYIEEYAKKNGYNFLKNVELELNYRNLNMDLDDEVKLKCMYDKRDVDDSDKLSWISDDESVATVDEDGNIKAKKEGKTNIIAVIANTSISCKLNITKYNLQNANIILENNEYSYDGKEKKPKVKVKKKNKILTKDKDYIVKYENNIEAGQAKVKIWGKGLFRGEAERVYSIKPAKVSFKKAKSLGLTSVLLEWKACGQVECYSIYRSDKENGKYKKIYITTKKNITSYKDKNLKSGQKYYYKVSGVAKIGYDLVEGETSDVTSVVPTLNAPKLNKIVKTNKDYINISWKSVKDAKGYIVYRKENKEKTAFEKIATISDAKKLSYTDKNIDAKKIYCYTVRAYKDKINGECDSAGVIAQSVENIDLKDIKAAGGFITSSWEKKDNVSGYYVYRREKGQKDFKKIYEAKQEELLYTDSNIKVGKEYEYNICSFINNNANISVGCLGKKILSAKSLEKPNYEMKMSSESDMVCTVLAIPFKNNGTKTLRILPNDAILTENEGSEFNRSLTLIDNKEYEKSEKINNAQYIDVKPKEQTYLMFLVDGYSTYYNMRSYLWFKFMYEGITYVNKSSYKEGTTFFEYIMPEEEKQRQEGEKQEKERKEKERKEKERKEKKKKEKEKKEKEKKEKEKKQNTKKR